MQEEKKKINRVFILFLQPMKILKATLNQLSNSTNPSEKHSFIIKKEVISPVFYLFIWKTWLMGNNPRQCYLAKEPVPGSCWPGGSRAIPTPAARPSSPPASTPFSHLPGVDPVTGEQVWLFQSTNWRAGSPRLSSEQWLQGENPCVLPAHQAFQHKIRRKTSCAFM